MNRFLRSKLVLSLAAFMMITAALIIPLSSSITRSHAASRAASAPPVTITEFPIPTSGSGANSITNGPDGNLWFTDYFGNGIGRITPNGKITEFSIPTSGSLPYGITTGPDGNLWFTEYQGDKIGKITTNGSITEYPIPPNSGSGGIQDITTGPDGNLWFTEAFTNKIGKITTNGSITEYSTPTINSAPNSITTGPDGNLWFTELNGNNIAKFSPDGNFIEYPILTSVSYPYGITKGPDGNIWFAEAGSNKIGKITLNGTVSEFPLPPGNSGPSDSGPYGVTTGPDGNIWFTRGWGDNIGKMTLDGTVTEYPIPTSTAFPRGIITGPDGNIWFAELLGGKIGRVNLPPEKHQKLFVLLQGINSGLTDHEAMLRNHFGMVNDFWQTVNNVPGIVPFLQQSTDFQNDYSHASFLVYSYAGSNPDGTPLPYSCVDTFNNVVLQDAINLDMQIKNVLNNNRIFKGKPTDVYLIGHSLGGVVAFTYLASLVTNLGTDHQFSLPPGASLKAVVSLDSPLGGIPSSIGVGSYIDFARDYFVTLQKCNGLTDDEFLSPFDLAAIYDSVSKTPPPDDGVPYPRGAQASVLGFLQRFDLSNEQIAEHAQTSLGTSFLAIGNTIDLTWNANQCVPSIPNFTDTQFLEDEGDSHGLYGREFTAGNASCIVGGYNIGNHKEVFHNSDVENGLLNFLIPAVGGTPNPLISAPGSDK